MNKDKLILIGVVAIIVGVIWYSEAHKSNMAPTGEDATIHVTAKEDKAKMYETAKELVGVQGFINSPSVGQNKPFKIADYIGKKVILVDFWTYSCINCQRTTPYLNAWWDKYKDQGLLIIGVETPEFEFEKDYNNVADATNKLGIKYPVVQDNNYTTWNAYGNRYWPHKYLIDIDGYIAYDHVGEGGYEESEMKIQELLKERMTVLGIKGDVGGGTVNVKEQVIQTQSPETYFGSARNEYFGNGKTSQDGIQNLTELAIINLNTLYLTGTWNFNPEYAENKSAGAKIIFKYNAKNVYFVGSSDVGVKIKVLQDGKPLNQSAGEDISKDIKSEGLIKESRLYKLINNAQAGEHTLEIMIESPGLKAFTFTFG